MRRGLDRWCSTSKSYRTRSGYSRYLVDDHRRPDNPVEMEVILSGSEKSPRMTVNYNEETIRRSRFNRQGTKSGLPFPVSLSEILALSVSEGSLAAMARSVAPSPVPPFSRRLLLPFESVMPQKTRGTQKPMNKLIKTHQMTHLLGNARRGGGGRRGVGGWPGAPGARGNRAAAFAGRRGGGSGGRNNTISADKFEGFIDQEISQPLGAFGSVSGPFSPPSVLITDATIWTCGPEGIVEQADLLVMGAKWSRWGKILPRPRGPISSTDRVCMSLQASSTRTPTPQYEGVSTKGPRRSQQRYGSVIRSTAEDINIYRQLAGGVTAAQLLHGSANPIGGQSAIVKWRWGLTAEQMKIENAPAMIKFALGENVKQSNWGNEATGRYPQTRMGVEQVIRDAFHAANQYRDKWNKWGKR